MSTANTQKPSKNRVVTVYHPDLQDGRPGIISNAWQDSAYANVNVFLDGGNDQAILAKFRESPTGNTLMSIPVLDAQDTDAFDASRNNGNPYATWPKFVPAGESPAAREQREKVAALEKKVEELTTALAGEKQWRDGIQTQFGQVLERLAQIEQRPRPRLTDSAEDTIDADARRAIAHIAGHISNDGSDIRDCVTNILLGEPPRGTHGTEQSQPPEKP